ncbi:MAG TPA: XcyI family restriction endonuclease [Ktedonobacteraceae bacterium]|nr:XcyI family restriction endonuclease [Ktedonobacteraceae bacterium]
MQNETEQLNAQDQLTLEAHQISYRLRSTFFYRKLKEYDVLAYPSTVAGLLAVGDLYNWDSRVSWGISEDAFTYIQKHHSLKLIQVFCHPKLLREYPDLLAYYRNIAALSQKSVKYLTHVNVSIYESASNNHRSLSDKQILSLVRLFNTHISLIIDSSLQSFSEQELEGLLLISTGAQIDGAWRNAIGEEAEKVVQRLLVKEAMERGLLSALIPRKDTAIEQFNAENLEQLLGNIGQYRGILLNNKTSLLFSSEPDISLIGQQGMTLGVIEVKGGNDPAGALERYGAAKKSFEETLRSTPSAKTMLVASCITPEVQSRIEQDQTISKYFNLTEIIGKTPKYEEFMQQVFSILDQMPDKPV